LKKDLLKIRWPNNTITIAKAGEDWFSIAKKANFEIPSGCLTGSCGACEIDVNGKTIRACISNIESSNQQLLNIEVTSDPYWN
tara:strand:+ start:407 stop:655 length:249 start_codon:yes stop_codon:yes gene_type:complete